MKVNTRSIGWSLILLAGAGHALAAEVAAPDELGEVRKYIVDRIEKGITPSLAVAVVRGDRVIWAEGFGYANVEKKIEATADSIYLLASVSKPITATGLMRLVDRGDIDLDKPVNDYLPGPKLRAYRGSADAMTVRRLANHTSGMPTHYSFFYNGIAPPPMDVTIERYGFASTEPGTNSNYSNLAFGILNYVTEVVSGTPWSEYMEREVYDPIGMTRTSDDVRPGYEREATRQYYAGVDGKFVRVAPYEFDHPGASAIWSSANDLAKFMRLHLGDGEVDGVRLLSEKSARHMRELMHDPEIGGRRGVAWNLADYRGMKSISHGGGMPGVRTTVRAFPEAGVAVVVLSNLSGDSTVGQVEARIIRTLFPDSRISLPSPPKRPPADLEQIKGKWQGRMAHHLGDIPVKLNVRGEDELWLDFGSANRVKMSEFEMRGSTIRFSIQGMIPVQETYHGAVHLDFNLTADGDRITGTVFARAASYFGISHWIELGRL